MINLTDENFEEEIKKAGKPALVDFFAGWCEPCSIIGPILEKLEEESDGKFILMKADVDKARMISSGFGVEQIPTIVLFKEGKPAGGFVGLRTEEEIKEWLKSMNI